MSNSLKTELINKHLRIGKHFQIDNVIACERGENNEDLIIVLAGPFDLENHEVGKRYLPDTNKVKYIVLQLEEYEGEVKVMKQTDIRLAEKQDLSLYDFYFSKYDSEYTLEYTGLHGTAFMTTSVERYKK